MSFLVYSERKLECAEAHFQVETELFYQPGRLVWLHFVWSAIAGRGFRPSFAMIARKS